MSEPNNKHDPLGKVLGIPRLEKPVVPVQLVPKDSNENAPDYDLEVAKENLHDLIAKGKTLLIDAIDLAQQSEEARAYTAAANVLKSVLEANRDLINLTLGRRSDKKEAVVENTTHNNLVVGSTKDVAEILVQMQEAKNGR